MFSHVTIGSDDLATARPFYDAVMACIGHERFYDHEESGSGYGAPHDNQLWVMKPFNGERATPGNGLMTAFLAPSRAAVDAFYATAIKNGGSDEGPPGLRPLYHENYYAAYVRDPTGNKLCVVCHAPE